MATCHDMKKGEIYACKASAASQLQVVHECEDTAAGLRLPSRGRSRAPSAAAATALQRQ